jgi:hypothetical protein
MVLMVSLTESMTRPFFPTTDGDDAGHFTNATLFGDFCAISSVRATPRFSAPETSSTLMSSKPAILTALEVGLTSRHRPEVLERVDSVTKDDIATDQRSGPSVTTPLVT